MPFTVFLYLFYFLEANNYYVSFLKYVSYYEITYVRSIFNKLKCYAPYSHLVSILLNL